MVCQHYRRCLYLSQARPTRRPIKDCPFPPGGGRWGWGGSEGEGVCPYRLSAAGISLLAALLVALTLSGAAHGDDELVRYHIIDGTIPEPLTAQPGDPERGRRMVLDRDGGDCTICHAMPLPQREFHGTIGPPLDGIGRRATPGALRLRLVAPKAFNAETIMPAYYKVAGLHRVLDRYRARPILTAQQLEDVIAYLLTLTD
jgi:sulfur-oxidizing protein SoxX